MNKKLVLLLVLSLFLPLSATTYYVAKTGNDGNNGSEAHPWLTIGHAVSKCVAGDTAWVKQGTYNEGEVMLNTAGTHSAPIVFKSYDGWNTIIQGAIQFNKRHCRVEDFKIIFDITVDNQAVKFTGDPDSSTVSGCVMYQNASRDTCCGILANSEGDDSHRIQHVVITNNTIHNFGGGGHGHGIYACGNHTVITHNIVYSNSANGIQNYPSADSDTVAYNVSYNNGGSGIVTTGFCNFVHDNICYGNASAGIHINASGIPNLTYNNEVSNNVFYANRWGIYCSSADSNLVRNNVSLGNTADQLTMAEGPVKAFDHNCYYPDGAFDWGTGSGNFAAYKSHTGQDAHGKCANPLFADSTGHDFHLQTSSPCIDVGDTTTPPGFDIDGDSTPQGSAIDMGGYEYHTNAESLDVGVRFIVAPTGTVDSGTVVTPKVRVKNYGTSAATFPVKFRIGSFYSDSQTVSNLAAGDSVQVSFTNWTALQRGASATRCTTALSGDQNYSNDALSGTDTVRVTNVGVTAIVAPTGTVDSGTTITPQARVKNYGTGMASFPVTFRIGSFYSNSKTVSNLAAGDSVLVSFNTWTALQRGTSATRCTTSLTADQIHSNDALSGSVTVRVTDVGVTAIIAPTGTVDSGTVVTPKARVRNYGTAAASFPVTFRIGSSYTNTQTVSSLAPGDSVQVSFTNWTAVQRGTSATRCTTSLTADQNHSNDALSGSVTVRVINVGVTAIVAPTDTVDSGTVVTPKARVKNYGTSAASFPVKFRIGSIYSDSQNVSSLAAGDSVTVSFTNWTPAQPGTFTKRCSTALSGDQVHSNDTLSGSVTVKRPTVIDVGVTAIIAPTGTVDSGTIVTPKARVKNYGTNVATFPLKFRIGSVYSDSQTVSSLAAGDSVQVSFTNWTAAQRGTSTTRCTTALSGDQNHVNDTLSGSVRVRVTNVGVTAIIAPTDTVDSGTVVTPKARVKNYGTDAASFPAFFRIGSVYSNSQSVTSLAAGDSVLVSFANWTPTQPGTFNKRCSTALSGDQIHSNDTLSGSVTVKRPTVIDVGVTAITAPTGTIDSGTVVTPKARVKNYGTNAATFPVKFRIGSFYSDSQTVTSLAAGDSVQVSFTNWTATQRGTSATRCTTALSGDQVHSNDLMSGSVTVKVTNVGVTAIVAPIDTLDSGATITPQARVKNYGTNAASFPVTFRIGNFYSNSQNVTNLAAGDSALVSFTVWTAIQVGAHVTRCSTALSGDQNHGNDTLSGTVTVRSDPVIDVGVTAIVAPVGTVDSGATITPQARVKNYGNSPATFPVNLNIGTGYTNTQTITNLASGDSIQVSFANWTAAPRGVQAARCTTGLTGDQNAANDTLAASVTVRVANVGVTAIIAPFGTVDSGATITPQARVKNYGTAAASFPVSFRIGSSYSDSQNVTSLAPGDSALVSFASWNAVQRGTSATRCTTALSGDQVHSDDTLSGSVTVRVIDVGVNMIVAPTDTVDSGTNVATLAWVRNYGTDPVSFPVKFHIDAFYSDSESVSNLAPGDSALVAFTHWNAVQRGNHVTRCTTALSGDGTPANNNRSGTVDVRTPGVKDVGVVGINRPVGTYRLRASVTPAVTVRNYGNVPVAFEVWVLLTSPRGTLYYSDKVNVVNLDPGNNLVVGGFRSCQLRINGKWTAKCSLALAGDAHLDNNVLTGQFAVGWGWTPRTSMPEQPSQATVKDGAWLAYDAGTGLIYASKGNKSGDFYSYNVLDDDWTSLRPIPLGLEAKLPRQGACGVSGGAGYVYMAKGNNTLGFWRYEVATDSWLQLANVPAGAHRKVRAGSGAVYVQSGDSGFVYLLKGLTNEFYRFNVATGEWETMKSAPSGSHSKWYGGSFLTFDGDHTIYAHKARYNELWAYDVLTDKWSGARLSGMPFVGRSARSRKSGDGGAGAWFEGGIYALKGGSTSEVWRYDAIAGTWGEFDSLPTAKYGEARRICAGGSVVNAGGTLFVLKGNKTNELWSYDLGFDSASASQPSREGVMAARTTLGDRQLAIGPNPLASGLAVLRYSLPKAGSATLNVFDVTGRTVLTQTLAPGRTGTAHLDLRKLDAGVYLVNVTAEGFSTTQKLVVEH